MIYYLAINASIFYTELENKEDEIFQDYVYGTGGKGLAFGLRLIFEDIFLVDVLAERIIGLSRTLSGRAEFVG